MPLITGNRAATPEGIAENIRRLIREGKTREEAIAIAQELAREARRRKKKREFFREAKKIIFEKYDQVFKNLGDV
jgi:hypothetical protein